MERSVLTVVRSFAPADSTSKQRGARAASVQRAKQLVTATPSGASSLTFVSNTNDDIIQAAVRNLNQLAFAPTTLPSPKNHTEGSALASQLSASPEASVRLLKAPSAVMQQRSPPDVSFPPRAASVGMPPSRHGPAPRRDTFSATTRKQRREANFVRITAPRPLTEQLQQDLLDAMRMGEAQLNDAHVPIDGKLGESITTLPIDAPAVDELNESEKYGVEARLKRLHDREAHSLEWIAYWARLDEVTLSNKLLLAQVQDNQRQLTFVARERDGLRERLSGLAGSCRELERLAEVERQHGQEMSALERSKIDAVREENERLLCRIADERTRAAMAETVAARAEHENDTAQRALAKFKNDIENERLEHSIAMVQVKREAAERVRRMEEKEGRLEFLESESGRQGAKIKSLEHAISILSGEKADLNGRLISAENRLAEATHVHRKAAGADATVLQQVTQKAFQRREAELTEAAENAVARAASTRQRYTHLKAVLRQRCELMERIALFAVDIDVHTGVRTAQPDESAAVPSSSTGKRGAAPGGRPKKAEPYACGPLEAIAVDGKAKVEARLQSCTPVQHMAPVVDAYQRMVFDSLPEVAKHINEILDASWRELGVRVPCDPQGRPTGPRETLHKALQAHCKAINQAFRDCVALHSDTVAFIGNKEAKALAQVRDEARSSTKAERDAATLRESRLQAQVTEERSRSDDAAAQLQAIEQSIATLFNAGSEHLHTVERHCMLPPLGEEHVVPPQQALVGPPELNALLDLLARAASAATRSSVNTANRSDDPHALERDRLQGLLRVRDAEISSLKAALATRPSDFDGGAASARLTPEVAGAQRMRGGSLSVMSDHDIGGVLSPGPANLRGERRSSQLTTVVPDALDGSHLISFNKPRDVHARATASTGTARSPAAHQAVLSGSGVLSTASDMGPNTSPSTSSLLPPANHHAAGSGGSAKRKAPPAMGSRISTVADIVQVMRASNAGADSSLGMRESLSSSLVGGSAVAGRFVSALRDVTRTGRASKARGDIAGSQLAGLVVGNAPTASCD